LMIEVTIEIKQTSYNYTASYTLPDGSKYFLEAHLELSTHPIDKYEQITFFIFDAMHKHNKKSHSSISVSEKERVFQALMARLQGLVVVVVVIKDNKWFELSKAKTLYYLKSYEPRPKRNTQMNLFDLM